MITAACAKNRGQARRFQREEPDRAAAVGSHDVGTQICFGKVGQAGGSVNLKRHQPDPRVVFERVELKSRRDVRANLIGSKGPMQEREPAPKLVHSKKLAAS